MLLGDTQYSLDREEDLIRAFLERRPEAIVLTGGEVPALAFLDAAVRLVPGVLNPESLASEAHRALLASEAPTVVTNLVTGGLARGFAGRLVRGLGPVRAEAPPYPLAAVALGPIRKAAEAKGEFGFGPLWAGQTAALGEALPAVELTRKLAAEALALLHPQA